MAATYSGTGVANDITPVIDMISSRMDEIIEKETVTAGMTASPEIIEAFGKSASAKIPTMTTAGLGDYDENKGYPMGQANLTWQEVTLQYDRGLKIDIDRKKAMQTDGLASVASAAASLMRLKVVPEVDATRISQAVAKTKAAKANHVVANETLTAANILTKIGNGIDLIYDEFGTDSGMTIYMNSSLKSVLRSTTEVTKVKQVTGAPSIDLTTESIDGNSIVWVPSSRMWNEYTYSSPDASGVGGGIAKKASNTPAINFMICAPGCAQGVTVIDDPKFIEAGVNQTKDAHSLMYRIYHDVIVEKNSGAAGIYASVGAAPSG